VTLADTAVHLASAETIVRVSLHVFAACVWVGGQVTLGGLVPTVRRAAPEALSAVARAFARLAWPAFAVLILTGIWNVAATHTGAAPSAWNVVFGVKMACVVAAGLGVGVHQRARTARLRGVSAGLGLLATVAALVLGVALAG
jgi:putative copper export protein